MRCRRVIVSCAVSPFEACAAHFASISRSQAARCRWPARRGSSASRTRLPSIGMTASDSLEQAGRARRSRQATVAQKIRFDWSGGWRNTHPRRLVHRTFSPAHPRCGTTGAQPTADFTARRERMRRGQDRRALLESRAIRGRSSKVVIGGQATHESSRHDQPQLAGVSANSSGKLRRPWPATLPLPPFCRSARMRRSGRSRAGARGSRRR